MTRLLPPSLAALPDYVAALQRGWSPHTTVNVAPAQLRRIAEDAAGFLAGLEDRAALGPPVEMPDGSTVPRLPGFARWIWDDAFCGSIALRWQPGTTALPPHVLGHTGFTVVPWQQRQGHATRALALLLPEARALGLAHVELTTDPDNLASQRVIQANGGSLVERFHKTPSHGGGAALRFRIAL